MNYPNKKGTRSRYLRDQPKEKDGRYNIEVGGFLFVQDAKDREKFHLPGGQIVNKEWIYAQAIEQSWGVPKKKLKQRHMT